MKKYVVTSTGFIGELIFKYDLNSDLIGFEIQATLSDDQRKWYFRNLPFREQQLTIDWPKQSKTIKVVEVPEDLSFDTFWKKYGFKIDKMDAEKVWQKMSDEERTMAMIGIQKYFKFLETSGTAKAYAVRYLRKKYYLNEY